MLGNGDGSPQGIPPDIQWHEGLMIFACSQDITHAPGCDHTCDVSHPNEKQVELLNEGRAWRRVGMDFRGIPTSLTHMGEGINVEIFDVLMWVETVTEVLVENGIMTKDELEERFVDRKLNRLHLIRDSFEDQVREMRQRAAVGIDVPKPKIVGPHGEILGG